MSDTPVYRYSIKPEDINIDLRTVDHYMGYGGYIPAPEDKQRIEKAVEEVRKIVTPKACYGRYGIEIFEEKIKFPFGTVGSGVLSRHIKGCNEVYIFAATIGTGFDRLLHRTLARSVADTAILQAAGAAAVEAVCDSLNKKLEEDALKEGRFLRMRFSPGYGDLPLDTQKGIFRLLDPAKNAGITLMDTLIMAPEKSVTAIIGIGDTKKTGGYETER